MPYGVWSSSVAYRMQPQAESIEVEIDNWGGVERQHLADNQAADDGDAERSPKLTAITHADRERQCAEHCRRCGHHDGTEAQ